MRKTLFILALLGLFTIGFASNAAAAQRNVRTIFTPLATELAPGTALDGVSAAAEALIPFTGEGSLTIPAKRINYIGARQPFCFTTISTSDDDAVETLQVRVRIGGLAGTLLADSGALIIGAASHTNIPWIIRGELVTKTAGATGTGYADGTITYQLGAAAAVVKPFYVAFTGFDFTSGAALVPTAVFAASPDGGDTVQLVGASIDTGNYNTD